MAKGLTGRPPGPMRPGRASPVAEVKLAAWYAGSQGLQPVSSLVDNFDDGVIDPLLWATGGFNGTVTEASGGMQLLCLDHTGCNAVLTGLQHYSLTASAVVVRLVQPQQGAFTGPGSNSKLLVNGSNGGYAYFLHRADGILHYGSEKAFVSAPGNGQVTYVAATHAWLRIRETGGTLYFDTAPSAASNPPVESDWSNLGAVTVSDAGWSPADVTIQLSSFIDGEVGVVPSGPAIFDGLNIASTVAGSTYTLTASTGAYTVTGIDATLLKSKVVVASQGAYTITGIVSILKRSRLVTASQGAYTVTGLSATLLKSKVVVASSGSYAVTGQSATLLRAKLLTASAGAYSVTGQSATLLKSKLLTASAGSYVINGQGAIITYVAGAAAYVLTAQAGSYVLTGQDATLLKSKVIAASAGSYAVAGQDATILKTRLLTASAGAYTIAGLGATLLRSRLLAASAGAYTVAGQDATLLKSRVLNASRGSYVITGVSATIQHATEFPDPSEVEYGVVYGPGGIYVGTMRTGGAFIRRR